MNLPDRHLFRVAPTRIGSCACGAAAVMLLMATPGRADVFEIGPEGAVIVRAGAGVANAAIAPEEVVDAEPALLEVVPDVPAPALTMVGTPAMPPAFAAAVLAASQRYQVSPDLLAAVVWQESRWQPNARSAKGALGLAQLMPATAHALAVDPLDASANLAGAAHYLRQMLDLFDGDVERALAAYNAGPERVLKAGGMPPIAETRAYVARIIDRLATIRATAPAGAQP